MSNDYCVVGIVEGKDEITCKIINKKNDLDWVKNDEDEFIIFVCL